MRIGLLLALGILVAGFWFGAFVDNFTPLPTTFYSRDLHAQFFPRFVYSAGALAEGRVPLWNPHELCGVPFLASAQTAVFNPIATLTFWLIPAAAALHTFYLIHFVLTGLLTYGFARAVGLAWQGAAVAAAAWTFSPALTRSLYHPNRIACLVWLPVIFWLGDRLCRNPTLRVTALLALALAAQFCAGYPQFALDSGLLLALYVLIGCGTRARGGETRAPWRPVALLGLAAVLAVMLAGVLLLPTLELIGESARSRVSARAPLMPGPGVLTTLFGLRHDVGLAYLSMLPAFYVGASTIILAVYGVVFGRTRLRLPLTVLSLACVLAVVGFKYLRMLPIYSSTRFSLTWAVLFPFFTALLAGIGTQALTRGPATASRAVQAGLVNLVVVLFLVLGHRLSAGFALVAGAAMLTGIIQTRGRAVLASLLLVIVVGDLFAHLPYWPGTDPFPPITRSSTTNALLTHIRAKEQPVRFLGTLESFSGVALTDRVQSITGLEGSVMPHRLDRIVRHFGLRIGVMDVPLRLGAVGRSKPLLDLMGLTYVAGPERWADALAAAGFEPLDATQRGERRLWRNPDALPRAFLVRTVRVIADDEEAFRYVSAPTFDPRTEAVVGEPLGHPMPPGVISEAESARVTHYAPEVVSVETRTAAPAFLVFTDTDFPGWKVTVDGVPHKIYRTDFAFRGVRVMAGSHTITFTYRPERFRAGAALSGIGLVAIAVLLLMGRSRTLAESDR